MAENSIGGINNVNNFNIGNGTAANTAKPILTAARTVQGMNKKNSLSAMTKDLIMQFPMFVDSSIPYETQVVVIHANERLYAAMQLALWSADTAFGVDPTSVGGVRDFVRKYHLNSETPDVISYAGNLTRNVSAFRGEYDARDSVGTSAPLFDDEDTEIEFLTMKPISNYVTAQDSALLWESVESRVNTDSINALYNPTKIYCDKLNGVTRALEAAANTPAATPSPNPAATEPAAERTFRDKYNSSKTNGYKADPYMGRLEEEKTRGSLNNAAIINDKKIMSLEPTMLSVEFFVRDPKGGGKIQKAVIGVKAMPRIINDSAMATNIIAALQGNHAAFQFVKWTRGETKFVRDVIFNMSQIKKDAITKDRFDAYFGAMRRRKNNASTFKFGDATVNPFTTLIISSQTVENIKQSAGYDLMDVAIAKRLISALYLLGLQIIDTSTGVVSTILDDWDRYTDTTVSALKPQLNKETDVTQIKETLRLIGRSVY